ncbi:MAG: hypothetical protein M0D55_10345 [Elusimicrobiota bacterium]|nr:MAG: hypothetical protein M0D55_10345 [Elusimicrobiota bacterium]
MMRAAHLLPLLLLAARASAGAPGPIDACAGGAAAINPNCGAGGGR